MFYFNLLVSLLVDFHVHFWLLVSKRAHLKGSLAKRGTSTEDFGGRGTGDGGRGGGGGLTPPLPPCFRGPAMPMCDFNKAALQRY